MSAEILQCTPVRSAAESLDLHATRLIDFYKNELRNDSERKAFAANRENRLYLELSKFKNSTIADSIRKGEELSTEQQRRFSKIAASTRRFLSNRDVCG